MNLILRHGSTGPVLGYGVSPEGNIGCEPFGRHYHLCGLRQNVIWISLECLGWNLSRIILLPGNLTPPSGRIFGPALSALVATRYWPYSWSVARLPRCAGQKLEIMFRIGQSASWSARLWLVGHMYQSASCLHLAFIRAPASAPCGAFGPWFVRIFLRFPQPLCWGSKSYSQKCQMMICAENHSWAGLLASRGAL